MKVLNYRADLDGIRGLAVLLVVLFHAWPETFKGGFVGVDVFFVLSGFLITSLIYGDVIKGSFRLRNFWFRRIRRLGPSLLVVISASAVAGWFLLLPDEYKQLGTHVAAGSVFGSNFLLISEAGYFDTSSSLKPLLHLWSLGVEEQFYVVFPLLLLGASRFKKMAFPSLIVFFLISFTLNIYFSRNDQIFDFYSPFTRFWELLAGAIVAIALSQIEPNKSYIAKSIRRLNSSALPGYFGLALLILSLFVVSDSRSYPGLQGLLPVAATIFMLISKEQSGLNKKVFSFKPIVWLGLISYPLYLWHWPLFSFARIVFGDEPNLQAKLMVIVLAVALSYLTFRFVETPIRKNLKSRSKIAVAIGFPSATVLVLGLILSSSQGVPDRSEITQQNYNASSQFIWKYSTNQQCLSKYAIENWEDLPWWFCAASSNNDPELLIVGNSHANHLYPGLVKSGVFNSGAVLSIGACGGGWIDKPINYEKVPNSPCSPELAFAEFEHINEIAKLHSESIKYVVMASMPPPGTWQSGGLESLTKRISFFETLGAQVIVFSPHLVPNYQINSCFSRPLIPQINDCVEPATIHRDALKDFDEFEAVVKKTNPKVLFFDQNSAFCNEEICKFKFDDGMPVFRDEFFHLSEYASIKVGNDFASWADRYLSK